MMAPSKTTKKSPKKVSKISKASNSTSMKAAPKASKSIGPSEQTQEPTSDAIYFYLRTSSPYSIFSQWYELPFFATLDATGPEFQTAEQYMMYQKAVLFADPEVGAEILATSDPKLQKSLGSQVKNFDQKVWEANRERIVEEASYWKFKNGRDEGETKGEKEKGLRERLEETGERELVEAAPMDRIWGVGFGAKNAERRRKHWGLNLLGKALVRARERLRVEEAESKSAPE